MFDQKKFSLPSVLQAEDMQKTNSFYLPKQEPQNNQNPFQNSFQYIKGLNPATQRNKQQSFSSKHFNFTENDHSVVHTNTERNRSYLRNPQKDQNSSNFQNLPQLSICQDNGTIQNKRENKDSKANHITDYVDDICNLVEIKKQLKTLESGESYKLQSGLKSPSQKVNKLHSLLFMKEGQSQQKVLQQNQLLDQYFILKNGSTQQSQNSFEKSFQNQSNYSYFKSGEINQLSKIIKLSMQDDSKSNIQQLPQPSYLKQIKQHSDILRKFSEEKYMKSPIISQQGEEINHILKQSKENSNSIHLAMKSFQIERGKKLFQFEKELHKIKENIMSKTYYNFPSRIIKNKSINDSLISQVNQLSILEEEKKQDTNMSQHMSPSGSISISQNAKLQQSLVNDQESKLNQTIIKFITDKSILQEDFIKLVLNQDNKDEKQNSALYFLKKRQMHFTQNPEVIDLLEQIDIHHRTLKNLGSQFQNSHIEFFKIANLDTIKKDILSYQKSFSQRADYKICQEREEAKQLQDWLRVMVDKVLKKSSTSFQQTFSELELIFHGCMQELVRQVCLQCQEKGEILCQIWNQYNYLISKLFTMHSIMNSKQNQREYDRLKFLTEVIDKKQTEFMTQIQNVQQRLDEEFENNQKVNDQNFYLRKKLNKIEKEKIDLQSEFNSIQQEFNELQTHHQHVLGKFNELEEQLNENIVQSLNKASVQLNTVTSSNSQGEQIGQDMLLISQRFLQIQQDKLVSQKLIQRQQTKLLTMRQIAEENNQQSSEGKKVFERSVSFENEIFVKNQEQKTQIEIEGINDMGINTSFKFFLDRVDVSLNTSITYENKAFFNKEVQTDISDSQFQVQGKKSLKSSDIFNDNEYQQIVNMLNNHILEIKNSTREKVNPEIYHKRLKDLRTDLLNTFQKKRVSIQEIRNKAINVQDQQQNVFKDVLQQLIESNKTVIDQKIVIAEKDIKISGLEEQINSQQLKIDILKHTYIENQLNDASANRENLDSISFEQIIESSHLINLNHRPNNRSSNQLQLSTFRNIVDRDGKEKELDSIKYQSNSSLSLPPQSKKDKINNQIEIQEEQDSRWQQKGDDSSIQNNDVTSLSNTNNFSNHQLSSTSIKKTERQISQKQGNEQSNKSKQFINLQNNKIKERKLSMQIINTNNSTSNSPIKYSNLFQNLKLIYFQFQKSSQSRAKQNSSFKKPSISSQINMTKLQHKDSMNSPKKKQVQPKKSNKQIVKCQTLPTKEKEKEKVSIMANREAAELILETAKVVIVQTEDYKQMNQIVKIINIIYNDCIKQYKKGESDGQQPIIYILYDWFLHRFGVKNIAEKKLLDFLVSIRKTDNNPKIHAFGKIVGKLISTFNNFIFFIFVLKGLYKSEILQCYDLQFFIRCMSQFEEQTNLAKIVNIQIEKLKINKLHILEACNHFFGSLISKKGIEEFIQSTLDEITLDIENFRNILIKNQIVNIDQSSTLEFDIDIVSERLLSLHIQLQEVYMQKYKGIFQIVQQSNFIGQEEFLILVRNLNVKDLQEIEIIQIFKQKADQMNNSSLQMSLKRFCMLCQENKRLFEKDQNDFFKFPLQINNINLIENKIHNVEEMKNNWELLCMIIKTRFIYSQSYKMVYQNMINQIQSFFQDNNQSDDDSNLLQRQQQSNRVMLIFRILCEESRRNILSYETNLILGEQFSAFSEAIHLQIQKIA